MLRRRDGTLITSRQLRELRQRSRGDSTVPPSAADSEVGSVCNADTRYGLNFLLPAYRCCFCGGKQELHRERPHIQMVRRDDA